jgi:hypothetical protein
LRFSPIENRRKEKCTRSGLTSRGFTKAQAKGSYEAAVMEEGRARSMWDIINGVTAYARTIQNSDDRVALELQAGKLMGEVAA